MLLPESQLGLFPSFHVPVSALACQLLRLQPLTDLPGVFLLGSLPVRQVTLLGVVVAVSNGPKFTRFAVDDGTGCLTCVLWKAAPSAASVADEEAEFASLPLELGELLRVQGRLTFYNDQLELVAACVNRVVDANEELLHWLSCTEVSRAT